MSEPLFAIIMIAVIVYLTRVSGYFVGLQFRHIPSLKPLLEALPGCAMMAILVPAVRQGDLREFTALVVVALIMWKTDNVVISSLVGILILLFGNHLTAITLS